MTLSKSEDTVHRKGITRWQSLDIWLWKRL